jgi:hypothetical protein
VRAYCASLPTPEISSLAWCPAAWHSGQAFALPFPETRLRPSQRGQGSQSLMVTRTSSSSHRSAARERARGEPPARGWGGVAEAGSLTGIGRQGDYTDRWMPRIGWGGERITSSAGRRYRSVAGDIGRRGACYTARTMSGAPRQDQSGLVSFAGPVSAAWPATPQSCERAVMRIFLSYRREDSSAWAGRLRDALSARLGEDNIFQDVVAVQPGQDFTDAVDAALTRSDATLVVIRPRWLTAAGVDGEPRLADESDYVRSELVAALASTPSVIPVLVGVAAMPTAAAA